MSFIIEEWSQSYPCWQELVQVIAEENQTGGVTPKNRIIFRERFRDKPITSMKRKNHTTEQIIAILRQADTGKTV